MIKRTKGLDRNELISMERFATALAMEAGEIQRRFIGRSKKVEHKGVIDLVTEVDRRCEEMIITRILESFPHHHVVAEEGQQNPTAHVFQWFVDPLDGTTNYVHGYLCFGVSIALAVEGEIVVGVVSDPMREETFSATKGGGAFLNGVSISVSKTNDLDNSLLATGFPYDVRESQNNNMDHFARFCLSAQGVRRDGSAALDLCYVATGRFDGFWEMKLHPWDLAAGVLIVTEAGGRVSDFGGGPFEIEGGEVVATNGLIHDQMVSVLNESRIRKED